VVEGQRPSPSSILKILAKAYILSTEYEITDRRSQLVFCLQERYMERNELQVKGHFSGRGIRNGDVKWRPLVAVVLW
jgi:hypothetical protein